MPETMKATTIKKEYCRIKFNFAEIKSTIYGRKYKAEIRCKAY